MNDLDEELAKEFGTVEEVKAADGKYLATEDYEADLIEGGGQPTAKVLVDQPSAKPGAKVTAGAVGSGGVGGIVLAALELLNIELSPEQVGALMVLVTTIAGFIAAYFKRERA